MTTDIISRAESELTAKVIVQIGRELGGRRWSQATLARALNVGPMWVSDRMTGRVRLTVEDLGRIAEAFNMAPQELLPGVTARYAATSSADHPGLMIALGATPLPAHPRLPHQANGGRRTQPTGRQFNPIAV